MQVPPDARVVVFTRVKRFAPPDFHRHILRGKVMGQTVRPGDRILVYEVAETIPPGGRCGSPGPPSLSSGERERWLSPCVT